MDTDIDTSQGDCTGLCIDGWQLQLDAHCIKKGDHVVRLEPKAAQTLAYFAQHAGEVVSRETLLDSIWPGMVVGDEVLTNVINKLRKALGDDARPPRLITTIPKKGYQLTATVTFNKDMSTGVVQQTTFIDKPVRLRAIVFVSLALLLFGGAVWLINSGVFNTGYEVVEKPTLVVLPFVNLSDDKEQEFFSDGISEDLIIDLSNISSLVVLSRTSAFAYKDKVVDISQVAKDLGARFVVEGSVRKIGDEIRISVNLIDATTNHSLWADRYDRAHKEIFAMQDDVTRNIVNALAVELTIAEKNRLGRSATDNFAAYESFMRGQQYFRLRSKEGNDLARDAYQMAIELDPRYARAYGALAVVLTHDYRFGWTGTTIDETRARALDLVEKAVALDRTSPQVNWSLSYIYVFRKEFQQAEEAVKQAIALSPNYADGYGLLAYINNWRGNAEQAIRNIEKATALNPYHTFDYPWNLGHSYYILGRYPEAVAALSEALERNEHAILPRLYLAASYVRLNQQDDAEWEIVQAMNFTDSINIKHMASTLPYEDEALKNAMITDLRVAGVPEE